ncbi:MAG: hypothetical protein AAF755_07365 [Pseudomonadota bacterium]
MRVEVHLGTNEFYDSLIYQNIAGNIRRLRNAGIVHANTQFKHINQKYGNLIHELEQSASKDTIPETVMRDTNLDLLERTKEEMGKTLLIPLVNSLGYHPGTSEGKGGYQRDFFPNAECIIKRLVSGFEGEDLSLHFYHQNLSDFMKKCWAGNIIDGSVDGEFEEFVSRCTLEDFLFSELAKRIRNELPHTRVLYRSYDLAVTDPHEFLARFFRDIGLQPNTMKISVPELYQRDRGDPAKYLFQDASLTKPSTGTIIKVSEEGETELKPDHQNAAIFSLKTTTEKTLSDLQLVDRYRLQKLEDHKPVTVFFMVEPGPLELQCHLLVSSLLVNCLDELKLIAFCRADRVARLHQETITFLKENEVELCELENDFKDGYPAGNKLIAAREIEAGDWAVFLDTDMIMTRPSSFLSETVEGRVCVCLDTTNAWSTRDKDWAALFETFDAQISGYKIRMRDGGVSYPLYNAGFVMFQTPSKGTDHFGRQWYNCAKKIDANEAIIKRRPWLDTISLATSLALPNSPAFRSIDSAWNCSTRDADEATRIVHYHGVRQLKIYGLVKKVDSILRHSSSRFNSLEDAITYHSNDMNIAGDLQRRAMRHGLYVDT